ncbi:uncharacterized protein MONOS_7462 [Monocercomonoides exilis]|uniref:uncharacterized protein n=1 Tax=Monocercomonoides exilis TaxID=2049356 RepID=UPI00355A7294|nr:hypothetical protein MONOS_7462 [Monocercomonoides exilis]|eukprot:MONOS_7462.1-p1 / transcript=MONOS_7462.1 / gene=MONOS_7462 / organism=Monocercomonoides_exilis_PA203 / gene_product=unspecified product / transcript_product=unspecified product / location=Mono_scaffold00255:68501-70754(-) / protein_length=681 / sequence_SO=supercontig / SO=protein_coding / is_pseudo=false
MILSTLLIVLATIHILHAISTWSVSPPQDYPSVSFGDNLQFLSYYWIAVSDHGSNNGKGCVHLYYYNEEQPSFNYATTIVPPDNVACNSFGFSVHSSFSEALNSRIVVISAPSGITGSTRKCDVNSTRGLAEALTEDTTMSYVFVYTFDEVTGKTTLVRQYSHPHAMFGTSVFCTFDGILGIGSPAENDGTTFMSNARNVVGAVHIYNIRDSDTSHSLDVILKFDGAQSPRFGASVSGNSLGLIVGGYASPAVALLMIDPKSLQPLPTSESQTQHISQASLLNENTFHKTSASFSAPSLLCAVQYLTVKDNTASSSDVLASESSALSYFIENNAISSSASTLQTKPSHLNFHMSINQNAISTSHKLSAIAPDALITGQFGVSTMCSLDGQSIFVGAPRMNEGEGLVYVLLNSMKCPPTTNEGSFNQQLYSTSITSSKFQSSSFTTPNHQQPSSTAESQSSSSSYNSPKMPFHLLSSAPVECDNYALKPSAGCEKVIHCRFGESLSYDGAATELAVGTPGGKANLLPENKRVIPNGADASTRGITFRYNFNTTLKEDKTGLRNGKFAEAMEVFGGGADAETLMYLTPSSGILYFGSMQLTNTSQPATSTVRITFAEFKKPVPVNTVAIVVYVVVGVVLLLMIVMCVCSLCMARRNQQQQIIDDLPDEEEEEEEQLNLAAHH